LTSKPHKNLFGFTQCPSKVFCGYLTMFRSQLNYFILFVKISCNYSNMIFNILKYVQPLIAKGTYCSPKDFDLPDWEIRQHSQLDSHNPYY
jgi:hypothetical protein